MTKWAKRDYTTNLRVGGYTMIVIGVPSVGLALAQENILAVYQDFFTARPSLAIQFGSTQNTCTSAGSVYGQRSNLSVSLPGQRRLRTLQFALRYPRRL